VFVVLSNVLAFMSRTLPETCQHARYGRRAARLRTWSVRPVLDVGEWRALVGSWRDGSECLGAGGRELAVGAGTAERERTSDGRARIPVDHLAATPHLMLALALP
jgi:hypothetical protein